MMGASLVVGFDCVLPGRTRVLAPWLLLSASLTRISVLIQWLARYISISLAAVPDLFGAMLYKIQAFVQNDIRTYGIYALFPLQWNRCYLHHIRC